MKIFSEKKLKKTDYIVIVLIGVLLLVIAVLTYYSVGTFRRDTPFQCRGACASMERCRRTENAQRHEDFGHIKLGYCVCSRKTRIQ